MTTNPYLSQVERFHQAFQYMQPTPTVPGASDETIDLRTELLDEELWELKGCLGGGKFDAVEALDALCDLQYVLSGAVLALGFSPVFDAAFAEVHRSNMSKLWTAGEVDNECKKDSGLKFNPSAIPGKWIATRSDGKIMKSPYYSPANLAQFIS